MLKFSYILQNLVMKKMMKITMKKMRKTMGRKKKKRRKKRKMKTKSLTNHKDALITSGNTSPELNCLKCQ